MADLNALIAQGAQFAPPPDPFAQYGKMQQLQQGDIANQLNLAKMDEYKRGIQEQNALRTAVSRPGFDPTNPEHQAEVYKVAPTIAPTFLEKSLLNKKTAGEISSSSFELQNKKANKAIIDITALNSADEAAASIDAHLAKGDITPDKAAGLKASLTTEPDFSKWQNKMILGIVDAKEKLTLTAPKPKEVKRADGSTIFLDENPNSKTYGTEVLPPQAAGMTPFQQASIRNQQGNLKVSQDRLAAEMATGNISPSTVDFIAETYRQTGTLPPLGMGPMAASLRSKILERAGQLSMAGGATPEQAAAEVKGNKSELTGTNAGQRAVGTQIANATVAANEANRMIDVAKPYVAAVNPTDYPILNAAGNYVARNTGDANVVGLATSLNSLVNTYARAINPKGVATVSDKNHAREIINTAMSSGQLNEAFKVMGLEMNAALASGPETRAAMRPGAKPAAAAAPAAGGFKYLGKESN